MLDRMVAGMDALLDQVLGQMAVRAIGATVHAAAFTGRAYFELTQSERDLSIERDVAYGRLHAQRLDVYRSRASHGPLPALLYLHGGGFQQLSRHTHAWFAMQFARAGYVVFNADYRLAPRHPYPAASDDARSAAEFVLSHGERYGVLACDLTVAGESAGANLALGLAISARPMPLRAVVLFSGLLQVSHPARLAREGNLSRVVRARLASIPRDYIGVHARDREPRQADPFLDPLLWLARNPGSLRAMPPVYASCGTRDPVAPDTLRLQALLRDSGVAHCVEIYDGEPHAFQGMPLRRHAQASWRACLGFLAASRARRSEPAAKNSSHV